MPRKSKDAARKSTARKLENANENKVRLEKNRTRISLKRGKETPEERNKRLASMKLYNEKWLKTEGKDAKNRRVAVIKKRLSDETAEERNHRLNLVYLRLKKETAEQRSHRLNLIQFRLSTENETQRNHRLSGVQNRLSHESDMQRVKRLEAVKARQSKSISRETEAEKAQRLLKLQQSAAKRRSENNLQGFRKSVSVFADTACQICHKMLYPQQRHTAQIGMLASLLPAELVDKIEIISCKRCLSTLRKRKTPAQAYWNKMTVAPIPPEIESLTEIERRLLSRVVPFLRILKVQNRFSQDWCKGQLVLFAQDVVEVAEQLPLQVHQAGIVIVAESLEHVKRCREFQIDVDKLKTALEWLLSNNSLYRDVRAIFSSEISIDRFSHIVGGPAETISETIMRPEIKISVLKEAYKTIDHESNILRGTFNQADVRFSIETRGKQCTGIAVAALAAFFLTNPDTWRSNDVDYILLIGDKYYQECINTRTNPDPQEVDREYLAMTDLVSQVTYDRQRLAIDVLYEHSINGHIDRNDGSNGFPNLKNALQDFFAQHRYGVLTCNSISIAVHSTISADRRFFWLFDSHSLGPKGCRARVNGVACCMKITNIEKLFRVLRRNTVKMKGSAINIHTHNIYCLTPIMFQQTAFAMQPNINGLQSNFTAHRTNVFSLQTKETDETFLNIATCTSMLHHDNEKIPALDTILSPKNNGNKENVAELKRKTAPPLNLEREKRMEELGWYFLFPDGKNGFGELRNVSITALDYFQARVMGKDKRFNRNDYLFFALSVVEYFRAKSSVSVSCKMQLGDEQPKNLIDNMHVTMRNIRGSSSYWRQACAELIAMIRTLGPPTWFLTFSCNDLHWPDMLQALLIADNRNVNDVENLSFSERLSLVQQYPVVVARQFNLRVNALMRYLKANDSCLGGTIADFWHRIEFQNRGSPHLHMLVWCENIPDFSTNAGKKLIDSSVHCSAKPKCPVLENLVKNVQTHRHTETCHKDRKNINCRFGFPRPVSKETVCLDPDEAIANNGRICVLRRKACDRMINNYSPILLELWQGNMDIQPCGNISAVAYYVAKYASKSEPLDTGDVVREAISKAKKRGGSLWQQLFCVSMTILSQRLVSAPECAYRLCHLPLKMSSRKAVFVNSCKPEERFRILRFENVGASYFNNIFDRYELRPEDLNDLSLAEFAVRYEVASNSNWMAEDGDSELKDLEKDSSSYIKLMDGTRMKKRTRPAVLRTRYYTLNSNRENYFYSLIVCHLPFRSEQELLLPHETVESCFFRRQSELKPLLPNTSTEQFTHAEHIIQQALAQVVAFNALYDNDNHAEAPETAHSPLILSIQDDFVDDIPNKLLMNDAEFMNNMQSLNPQQKELFVFISNYIRKDMETLGESLLLFITGGAGSGKSFVLKLLVEHIKRCYAPTVDAIEKPTFVEVASLTGVAARQIYGKTLHSLFALPIEKGSSMPYKKNDRSPLRNGKKKVAPYSLAGY